MSFFKLANKWFSKYKNSLFLYKDGFFELPWLANSPETVVQSISKMPFVKHYKDSQLIKSKTPFVSGCFYYEKIEEGLWIIQGDFNYNVNVNFKRVIDKNAPSEYHFLCLKLYGLKQKNPLMNGIAYTNCSWLLFKPNAWSTNCQFKGARELTFTIFFNDKWLKEVFYKQQAFIKSGIRNFFESDAPFIIWPDNPENIETLSSAIYENFRTVQAKSISKKAELRDLVYELFVRFIDIYDTVGINTESLEISDTDRKIIYKAEKLLLKDLSNTFQGIEQLAKDLGISETKLKASFKQVFGKSTFQYFQEKQMLLAKSILMEKKIMIKDLANTMGYENASKFAAAFKKQIGHLPSELQ